MQKERAIDLQFIKPIEVGSSALKGKMTLISLFKTYLTRLNVGFYDPCCDNPATCPPISAQPDNAIECLPDGLYVPPGGGGGGSVMSVGLTMPAAFSVANSPVTTTGVIAVTGAGTTAQYVRGDGSLAAFPAIPPATTPACTNDQIQFNNNGVFGANTLLRWTGDLSKYLQVGDATYNGQMGQGFINLNAQFIGGNTAITMSSQVGSLVISNGADQGTLAKNRFLTSLPIYIGSTASTYFTKLLNRATIGENTDTDHDVTLYIAGGGGVRPHMIFQASGLVDIGDVQDGAFEYDGDDLYFTIGVDRQPILRGLSGAWVSNTPNNINNTNLGGVGIGAAITNPTAYLHIAGGTTVFPSIKLNSGSLLSAPVDGSIEYDGVNLYFTIGTTRKAFPLATTDNTIYTGDGNIAAPRAINVQNFSVTWNNVGLFRIVEGDATIGGTYDFNDGVDFLAYDAVNSANLVLNSVSGVSIEYSDVVTPALITSFVVDGTGIKLTNIDEYADNAAALVGGLTAGYLYRTGDNLKIVH